MTLEWKSHPAAQRPHDVMLAIGIIALTAYAVLVGLGSAWLAAAAAGMLVVAIMPFLAPTYYRLDGDGVTERRLFVTRARRWSELRRCEVGRGSALVSPFQQRRWLDRYRGLRIRFDGGDRDAIVGTLTTCMKAH